MFRERAKGRRRDRPEDGVEGDPRQEPRVPLQPPGTGAGAAHDREHHRRLRFQCRRLVRGNAYLNNYKFYYQTVINYTQY